MIFGLLDALLTVGCWPYPQTECEITCVDGFKTTEDDDCDNDVTAALAQQHGGSCRSEEHIKGF
jgi:hypothetical protein